MDIERLINLLDRVHFYFLNMKLTYPHQEEYSEHKTAVGEAISILKRQKPVEIEREGGDHCWWFVCEECHGMVDDNDSYCRHCGRPFRKEIQQDA